MMNVQRWWRVGAVATATAMVVSGCGLVGGDDGETERESIDSIFGMDAGSSSPEDWRAQDEEVQQLIATCMQEKGWEYIPVVYPDEWYDDTYEPGDERERIEREGFGIAYWALYPMGEEGLEPIDMGMDFTDPNQDYIDSLSSAEMEQYYADLYGSEEEWEEATVWEVDPETGEEYGYSEGSFGCEGESYDQVNGGNNDVDVWDAMSVFYDELYARVEADPRILELESNWTQCMSDAGYDFADQDDFWTRGYEELYERYDSIMGFSEWVDPMAGWTDEQIDEFWNNATDAEIDELFGYSEPDLTDEQRTQLEALLADEIELALAEHDCSSGHWDTYEEIYQEIETQYVRENRAAIEEAAGTASGE